RAPLTALPNRERPASDKAIRRQPGQVKRRQQSEQETKIFPSLKGHLREVVAGHSAGDAQALSAQLVYCVLWRVPGRVIKIDQVDDGNAELVQRRLVVRYVATEI